MAELATQKLENQWHKLAVARRCVVKVGSALLTADGVGLDRDAIAGWVDQLAALKQQGLEIVLVSSGSIAEGMSRLGISKRPHELHRLQASAAIGQMGLVQVYESNFQRYQMHTAQILLTHDDLSNRQRYLNARSTVRELLKLGVVPVINENDTVVTDEIRFGDNDSLGALVANLIEADALVILTDRAGLYDKDPRTHSTAQLVPQAYADDARLDQMAAGSGGPLGRGGMITKIKAARMAARSGAVTVIAGGREQQILTRLFAGERLGTLLAPDAEPLDARKQWLAGHLKAKGRLVLDDGAVRVLQDSGRSLLAVGVKGSYGKFVRGDLVDCENLQGECVARGLVNYNADEVGLIMGLSSDAIETTLGYVSEPELIHRDNMVVSG